MKDLKCGLKCCRYNKGYCCCSREIHVGANTDCKTYSPDENKRASSFEASDEFVRADYSVDTRVACNADACLFNRGGSCVANGITVMSENASDAACLTFVKK